jgi:hypothetical protein
MNRQRSSNCTLAIAALLMIAAPLEGAGAPVEGAFTITGTLENRAIDEASGLQAGANGVFYTHNDGKRDVFVIDETGRDLGAFKLDGAKNRDWEDITRVPHEGGQLLVISDSGDNQARYSKIRLYFFAEPAAGDYERDHEVMHRTKVTYPDGPRDVEAAAWDPSSRQILLLSKRDQPPRLYGVPLDRALAEDELEAIFLGELHGLRPPTRSDLLMSKRGRWVSQPTGLDISPDGRIAAVLTYRSLYLYTREEGETWAEAFRGEPQEFIGPPGTHDEAVAFSPDGRSVYVTTERRPAPVYRLDLP